MESDPSPQPSSTAINPFQFLPMHVVLGFMIEHSFALGMLCIQYTPSESSGLVGLAGMAKNAPLRPAIHCFAYKSSEHGIRYFAPTASLPRMDADASRLLEYVNVFCNFDPASEKTMRPVHMKWKMMAQPGDIPQLLKIHQFVSSLLASDAGFFDRVSMALVRPAASAAGAPESMFHSSEEMTFWTIDASQSPDRHTATEVRGKALSVLQRLIAYYQQDQQQPQQQGRPGQGTATLKGTTISIAGQISYERFQSHASSSRAFWKENADLMID